VCARGSAIRLRREVDEFDCIEVPETFAAVGQFYFDFRQTSDEEVVDLLRRAAGAEVAPAPDPGTEQARSKPGGTTPQPVRTTAATPPARPHSAHPRLARAARGSSGQPH
jgi:hypothetical protein